MIGDPTEAEDLTQGAFLLLFRKIHTFRGESAFSAWLQRLAVSVVLEATPDPEDEMVTRVVVALAVDRKVKKKL